MASFITGCSSHPQPGSTPAPAYAAPRSAASAMRPRLRCAPQTRPVVCVNKLVGYESPQVRTFDYDPNVWGLTYQMIYPYSVSTQYADGIVVVKPE